MSKVVNLNKARKKKMRETAEKTAAENRVKFGRTREQRLRDETEAQEARQRMDRLRREPPDGE